MFASTYTSCIGVYNSSHGFESIKIKSHGKGNTLRKWSVKYLSEQGRFRLEWLLSKRQRITSVGKDMGNGNFPFGANWCSHYRTVWRFLKNFKIELPYDPVIPLLGIYANKQKQSLKGYLHSHLTTTYSK